MCPAFISELQISITRRNGGTEMTILITKAVIGDECDQPCCNDEICEECEELIEDCECEDEDALYQGRIVTVKYPSRKHDTMLSAL